MEPCVLVSDQVFLATMDSFFVFSVSSMAPLSSMKWLGKPYVSQYSLDTVTIVQGRPELNGLSVLVVLASKMTGFSAPGVSLSLFVSQRGQSVSLRTSTFFDTSPTNMHIPLGYNIHYWTQLKRNDTSTVYVNSRGGWPNSPTLIIPLPPGYTISHSCFGEYPITSVGILCAGNTNSTQAMLGLHLAYGQGQPPEILPGQLTWGPMPAGAMQWAIQPNRLLPFLYGAVQLPQGSYGIEVFEFAYMGSPPSHLRSSPSFLEKADLPGLKTSNDKQEDIDKQHKAHLEKRIFSSSPFASQYTEDAPNCVPSRCSFDEPGDCPPDHCWVFGGTGQFMCCMRPPI